MASGGDCCPAAGVALGPRPGPACRCRRSARRRRGRGREEAGDAACLGPVAGGGEGERRGAGVPRPDVGPAVPRPCRDRAGAAVVSARRVSSERPYIARPRPGAVSSGRARASQRRSAPRRRRSGAEPPRSSQRSLTPAAGSSTPIEIRGPLASEAGEPAAARRPDDLHPSGAEPGLGDQTLVPGR